MCVMEILLIKNELGKKWFGIRRPLTVKLKYNKYNAIALYELYILAHH